MSKTKLIGVVIGVFFLILMVSFYQSCREASGTPVESGQIESQASIAPPPNSSL